MDKEERIPDTDIYFTEIQEDEEFWYEQEKFEKIRNDIYNSAKSHDIFGNLIENSERVADYLAKWHDDEYDNLDNELYRFDFVKEWITNFILAAKTNDWREIAKLMYKGNIFEPYAEYNYLGKGEKFGG